MNQRLKKIISVSPRSIGPTEEVVKLHCECAKELGAKISAVSSIKNLYPLICDTSYNIDYISIDLDSLKDVTDTDLFNDMTTLFTILDTMPERYPDGRLKHRETVVVGAVGLNTDTGVIREFLSMNDRIAGIFPEGSEFTKDEKFLAMSEFLAGHKHIPLRVQDLLRRRKSKAVNDSSGVKLTTRQRQVLSLITNRGSSNKVIAKILNISESTVKLHLSHIFKKYGVRNRTQLALFSKDSDSNVS
jgi:DNA-binding CsgD family transcriptional regulator